MERNSKSNSNDIDNQKSKEIINFEYPKVTCNLLEDSNKIDFDKRTKISKSSSNRKSKNSPPLSNYNESKKKMTKLSKANLELDGLLIAKSSHNIKNNLVTKTFIQKAKIAKTKSNYESNNNQNSHKRSKLEKTKNNFLKLITKTNEGNYEKDYKDSKYSLLYNKNVYEVYEGDYLDKLEQKLKSKIIDMGKEAEFMEFEIGPLDISIDKFNLKKKKKKYLSKKTKDFERKKYEKNKKFIKTAIHKKHLFSQLSSPNLNNLNSENINQNKSNQYLDDSKLFLNEKNRKSNNVHSSSKVKFSSSNNKKSKSKSKSKSDKESNFSASNFKKSYNNSNFFNSKMNSKVVSKLNSQFNSKTNSKGTSKLNSKRNSKVNSRANLIEKITSILKTNTPKLGSQKKETAINKSKTYSNVESRIGQTLIENTESFDKINSLTSEKEVITIDKEKFRILSHKKLVYDSLDDEELIEDAVIENFYFNPNSTFIIIIDTMVLIFTFWSMVYKPLYLVLNNCDIRNTITSKTFNNISNLFIDILFICDLIINFFKAYYNFEEQIITKSNLIILHYIKGYFLIDLISAIPYYSIIKFIALNRYLKYGKNPNCSDLYNHQINDWFQILEILKLIKAIKCIDRTNVFTNLILNQLNVFSFFENWLYLIFNVIFFFLLLHLTACIHIFISCTAYPNWIILNNLNFSSFPTIYLSSIYFLITTVTSVGYGDIIGKTITEFYFQIVILVVGIIAYSWLISSLSNYVKENNKQNEIFHQKINMLNEIKLEHQNMSKELYDKIYLHLEYINQKQKKDKSSLIDSLPHTVKKNLLYEMYKPIIENFNFFKNFKNSEFINRVISKLKPIIAVKNDLLFDQGEIIEETFFVKQGRLSLEVKIDTIYPEKSVQKLLNEEYFFGVENNELYQKNAFGLVNMTTIKQTITPTINKKNLYNLYSKNTIDTNNINQKNMKSILTNDQGKGEILKHQKANTNYIYLKILDIRKNEHFGALLMFINKRSPLSLRVKTKKAELYFLKKIDAIEISSSYPNIWKRVNKASFHNLKQIKKIMHKIIIHYCETYGINFMKKICKETSIKNMNDLKKLYTIQNQISKDYYNNKFTVLQKTQTNDKRYSALINKSQLRMLKEFINNNTFNTSKPYEEKPIAQKTVIKDLELETKKENNQEENNIESKKFISTISNEDQLNCTLNMIKIKKNKSSNKQQAVLVVDENKNKNNSKIKKISNNILSEESKETKTKEEIKNNKINYGKEETKQLIQNYGTPFYPEDINDEIYPQEIQSINSYNNKIDNNSKVEELEYMPANNILSSQESIKNNYIKTIQEYNMNLLKKVKREEKNVTINNNFITNNVINNINPLKIKSELKTFHFGFNFKSKQNDSSITSKYKNDTNKIYNLAIFKNSFELSAFKNDEKIDVDLNNILKENDKEEKDKNKINNDKKIIFTSSNKSNNFSSNESCNSKNISSCSIKKEKENKDNIIKYEISAKKIIHSSSSNNSTIKQIINIDKKHQIYSNRGFQIKAEYFNLNLISNGKFAKNQSLQDFVKNAIIKKISDLTHSNMELPEVRNLINSNRFVQNSKKKISKKFSAFIPMNFLQHDKLKKMDTKNQKSNLMSSELNDNRKESNIGKRKLYKKSNNITFMNYINRNIRDDSAVLNNPEKFYNGLFNDIMKKYNKVNIKQFQK